MYEYARLLELWCAERRARARRRRGTGLHLVHEHLRRGDGGGVKNSLIPCLLLRLMLRLPRLAAAAQIAQLVGVRVAQLLRVARRGVAHRIRRSHRSGEVRPKAHKLRLRRV